MASLGSLSGSGSSGASGGASSFSTAGSSAGFSRKFGHSTSELTTPLPSAPFTTYLPSSDRLATTPASQASPERNSTSSPTTNIGRTFVASTENSALAPTCTLAMPAWTSAMTTPSNHMEERTSPAFRNSTRFPTEIHSSSAGLGAGVLPTFQSIFVDGVMEVPSSTMKQMVPVSLPVFNKLSPFLPMTTGTRSAGISRKATSMSSSLSVTFAQPCRAL
mmetsp:Transcript_108499/g.303880  ORF Transcript_108499/g.303880 Transcript_108499/m.303880 type:complete len:219 (-) Transcript_108499:128-784(-)